MNRREVLLALLPAALLLTRPLKAAPGDKATIIRAKCVGCGDCVRGCPVKAIRMENGKAIVNQDDCVGCRMCVRICSYGAPR